MNIAGKITGIKYKVLLADDLKEIDIENFDINDAPSACLLADNNHTFAISKWVSPKRTRSYPFERVFNTLHVSKKITVIPIVKDEGAKGDRDFIQWDTVSSERYPNYVCSECQAKATDENNRPLKFYNTTMLGGGFAAEYADTNKKRESHICYIDGIKCRADEARFGGIIIQTYGKEK